MKKQQSFPDIEYSCRKKKPRWEGFLKIIAINRVMAATGHMMKGGTMVDATSINAPSSTKNEEKARDPEHAFRIIKCRLPQRRSRGRYKK